MQTYHRLLNGQIVKAPRGEGHPLPHKTRREIWKSFRSKYMPHVGKKQLAKMSATA